MGYLFKRCTNLTKLELQKGTRAVVRKKVQTSRINNSVEEKNSGDSIACHESVQCLPKRLS